MGGSGHHGFNSQATSVSPSQRSVRSGRFYTHLRQGKTKDAALWAAQLDLIRSKKRELSHPYNWAGFSLYGDWRYGRRPLQRVVRQLPDPPCDDRALRATRHEVAHNEAALVWWRLSAHEALELPRLWMRHVVGDCRAHASHVEDRK